MDALYILGSGSKWGNSEIRFSLRSLEKFCPVDRVFVVGENPKRLNNNVLFFRVHEAAGNREYRIASKIMWACRHTGICPEFLFLNDDHIFLEPVDPENYPYFHGGNLADRYPRKKELRNYQESLRNTHRALLAAGYPSLHFDIHAPIRYRRDAFLALAPWWEQSRRLRNGLVVKSIYGNVTGVSPAVELADCKLGRSLTGSDDVQDKVRGRHVFSFGDNSLSRGVASFLGATFPNKSKFEL